MTSAETLPRPGTPPPPTASSSKRMLTPEGSPCDDAKRPKLKKITSAIRNAFQVAKEAKDLGEESKFGLLNFFSRGTAQDKRAYFEREDERAANIQSVTDNNVKNVNADKKEHERELGRLRQQKRRQLLKVKEIKSGERSPGGTKRKVSSTGSKT